MRGLSNPGRRFFFLAAAVALGVSLGGILVWYLRPSPEPAQSPEDALILALGRSEMTPAEISERLDVADSICRMNDSLLSAIWKQLDDQQMQFQDFAIANICPDRAIFFAEQTGRAVTAEAVEANVTTSTNSTPSIVPPPSSRVPPSASSPTQADSGSSPIQGGGATPTVPNSNDGSQTSGTDSAIAGTFTEE